MKHTVDLSKWLEFWGVKGGQVPDLVPSVQPVVSLGTTELVVPEFAPSQNFGNAILVPTNHATWTILAPAEGGALVDWLGCFDSAGAQLPYRWQIRDSSFGGGSIAGDVVVETPVSIMRGTDTTALGPPFMFANNESAAFRPLYIPGGKFGCIQCQVAATTALVGARVRDVVTDRGDA